MNWRRGWGGGVSRTCQTLWHELVELEGEGERVTVASCIHCFGRTKINWLIFTETKFSVARSFLQQQCPWIVIFNMSTELRDTDQLHCQCLCACQLLCTPV